MNNNIAFIDLEIDGKGKIMDAGAVMAGKKLHTSRIAEVVKFISDADFLCGHNIVEHDYQYLKPFLKMKERHIHLIGNILRTDFVLQVFLNKFY